MHIKKFLDENIVISKSEEVTNYSVTDDEINEKYINGEIRIVTEQARYPLDTICSMLDSGKTCWRN